MSHSSQDLPPDLLAAARAVEEQAPRLTEPELGRVKRRVVGPATGGRARVGRTRVAIVALLASGGLMTSGGAALGVSALSTDLTARSAQYGQGVTQSPGTLGSGVAGVSTQGNSAGEAGEGDAGVAGAVAEAGPSRGEELAEAQAQRPRQLSASAGDELPFTGWAAIPMLLAGIALLASGLVARSRSRGAPSQP